MKNDYVFIFKVLKCPYCKVEFKDEGDIRYSQKGENIYDISEEEGQLVYDQDEFEAYDSGVFYCNECVHDLDIDEKQCVIIFKKIKKAKIKADNTWYFDKNKVKLNIKGQKLKIGGEVVAISEDGIECVGEIVKIYVSGYDVYIY